mmetsp:Transcript_13852/g.35627  ORF Transcript_13852/g.35627 Transcript_13852/m.35627 type:complete len:216 (-) Transcript_13852:1959-2606(-)
MVQRGIREVGFQLSPLGRQQCTVRLGNVAYLPNQVVQPNARADSGDHFCQFGLISALLNHQALHLLSQVHAFKLQALQDLFTVFLIFASEALRTPPSRVRDKYPLPQLLKNHVDEGPFDTCTDLSAVVIKSKQNGLLSAVRTDPLGAEQLFEVLSHVICHQVAEQVDAVLYNVDQLAAGTHGGAGEELVILKLGWLEFPHLVDQVAQVLIADRVA